MPSTSESTKTGPSRVLLAAPRGYCAGVDRAVQTVERALDLYGAPVYVRKEIVHNKHVVEQLRERGAVFVDQETEVPEGETVVFSAHGVSPAVHRNAETRALRQVVREAFARMLEAGAAVGIAGRIAPGEAQRVARLVGGFRG